MKEEEVFSTEVEGVVSDDGSDLLDADGNGLWLLDNKRLEDAYAAISSRGGKRVKIVLKVFEMADEETDDDSDLDDWIEEG